MSEHVEDRLRRALRSRAEDVEPAAGDVAGLEARAATARHTMQRRRVLLSAAAVVVLIAAVAGGIVLAADDDEGQELATEGPTTTVESSTTTTSTSSTTTTTATTAPTIPPPDDDGVPGWPGLTSRVFDDPQAAALNFAIDVLGFAEPTEAGTPTGNAEETDVTFSYRSRPTAGITTEIAVHRTGADRGWVVTGTTSDEGTIEDVTFDGSAVTLSGSASAFEATLLVLVLDQEGDVLAETFTGSGANGEQGPFETTVEVAAGAGTPFWVMIAEGDNTGEGRFIWATTATLNP